MNKDDLRLYRKAARTSPWVRIILAAEQGHGARFTADEVARLSMDQAIETRAWGDVYDPEGESEQASG